MKVWILNTANTNMLADMDTHEVADEVLYVGMVFADSAMALKYTNAKITADLRALVAEGREYLKSGHDYHMANMLATEGTITWVVDNTAESFHYGCEYSSTKYMIRSTDLLTDYSVSILVKNL